MTFKSRRIDPKGSDVLLVTGDLTLRGVTKEVQLHVERGGVMAKDPWGKRRAGFVATTKINRKDFGGALGKINEGGRLLLFRAPLVLHNLVEHSL